MLSAITNAISVCYYLLFFFVPLVLFPKTSELFEFNKIVLTYILTTAIICFWITKSILAKKIIFKRTFLDIPLLIFLGSQFLSTLTSIDFRTSLFGYYSRYHGGFISILCYSFLYWAYVSNLNKEKAFRTIYFLLASAVLVSLYGVLEHFGIDKEIWVQDVQNRVFSTLGQPNWLAAWLVAIMPITWALSLFKGQTLENHSLKLNKGLTLVLSGVYFLTLLYTKSRSGILAFTVSLLTFWGLILIIKRAEFFKKPILSKFLILNCLFLILVLFVGTPWTPSINNIIAKNKPTETIPTTTVTAPALETGGTESGEIRKIVWQGAIDVWKNYPILGTGVETFAFSYYQFRPIAHNLVSEWDFLYNKAHNEYLNILATTGTVGFISYFVLVVLIIVQISNFKFLISKQDPNHKSQNSKQSEIEPIHIALLAGFTSILVTNFFGFSVVPVGILFFLYPAIAVSIKPESGRVEEYKLEKITYILKVGMFISCSLTLLLCYSIFKYWYADYLYSQGINHNDAGNYVQAQNYLKRAIKYSSKEAIFWSELSEVDTSLALIAEDQKDEQKAKFFADKAIEESSYAIKYSPRNVNILRKRASMFIKLSILNPSYLLSAKETLLLATEFAPTEAKLFYNLGLTYLRTGESEKAIEILEKTVEMKANYRDARFALALVYIDEGKKDKAKEQLEYILAKISPEDNLVKQELEEIKN